MLKIKKCCVARPNPEAFLANGFYLYIIELKTLDGKELRSPVKKLVILR